MVSVLIKDTQKKTQTDEQPVQPEAETGRIWPQTKQRLETLEAERGKKRILP